MSADADVQGELTIIDRDSFNSSQQDKDVKDQGVFGVGRLDIFSVSVSRVCLLLLSRTRGVAGKRLGDIFPGLC